MLRLEAKFKNALDQNSKAVVLKTKTINWKMQNNIVFC